MYRASLALDGQSIQTLPQAAYDAERGTPWSHDQQGLARVSLLTTSLQCSSRTLAFRKSYILQLLPHLQTESYRLLAYCDRWPACMLCPLSELQDRLGLWLAACVDLRAAQNHQVRATAPQLLLKFLSMTGPRIGAWRLGHCTLKMYAHLLLW